MTSGHLSSLCLCRMAVTIKVVVIPVSPERLKSLTQDLAHRRCSCMVAKLIVVVIIIIIIIIK